MLRKCQPNCFQFLQRFLKSKTETKMAQITNQSKRLKRALGIFYFKRRRKKQKHLVILFSRRKSFRRQRRHGRLFYFYPDNFSHRFQMGVQTHIPLFTNTHGRVAPSCRITSPEKCAGNAGKREREREVIKKSLTTSTTTTTREDLLISYTIIRAGSSQRSELVKLLAQASSWRQLCIYYTFRYLSFPYHPHHPLYSPFHRPPFVYKRETHCRAAAERERNSTHETRGNV